MHLHIRRAATLLAAPALTVTALVATSAQAQAAPDSTPVVVGAGWLADEVPESGIILTEGEFDGEPYSYDDYGLSIDVGFALDAVGGHDDTLGRVVDGIEANADAYTAPGYGTLVAAGAAGKALSFLQATDGDTAVRSGLLSDLESTVATEGAIAGRVQDQLDPEEEFATDYASVISQSWAVEALDGADSTLTDSATDFLLAQQCKAGFFRQQFSAPGAPDQTCDGSAGEPDVDATSHAVRALAAQLDDDEVAEHVADAVAWLQSTQKANGGFGADANLPGVNANSTGLAGYALALAGATGAAEDAAAWLRAHQTGNVANCRYYAETDLGAIAYDNAARTALQGSAIDVTTQDQFRRGTAQALPALQWAQAGAGEPHALFTAEYVRAGARHGVGVTGATPGEALCAMLGEQSVLGYANADGEANLRVLVPGRTRTSTVDVANAAGTFDTVEIDALGAADLKVGLQSKRVAGGKKQTITVRGLAPAEPAEIQVTWPRGPRGQSGAGAAGQANNRGVLKVTIKAPKRPGTAKVKAFGQFKNRTGSTSFTVTR
jgi:hypothetical protein